LHLYTYVANDPSNSIDPSGMETGAAFSRIHCATSGSCPRSNSSSPIAESIADFTPVVGDAKAIGEAIANPTKVNIAAATIGVVPGAGDLIAKGLKAAGNIVENAAKGKAGEAITRAKLGDKVAGEQVTFYTSDGTRTRTDFVTTDKGVVETKTGGAKLSSGQSKLREDIEAGREVTPAGQKAADADLTPGVPTRMRTCTIDRPC